MDGRQVLLACLVLVSYLSRGRTTKEANICWPEIPCDDLECILRDDWCDKFTNCYDDSDENYCETHGRFLSANNNCNATVHFVCGNGKCVPKVLECDGFDDCKDNSDENKCPDPEEHEDPVSTSSLLPDSRGDVRFPDSLTATDSSEERSITGNGLDPRVTRVPVSTHEYDRRGSVPRHDSRTTQAPFNPYEYDRWGSVPHPYSRTTQAPFNPYEYDRRGSVPRKDPRATQAPFNPYEYDRRGSVPRPDPRATQAPFNPYEYDRRGNVPRHDPRATQAPFNPYEYDRSGSVPRPDPRATQAPVNHREYGRGGSVPYPDPRAHPGSTLLRAWPLPVFRFQEDRQESFARRYGEALLGAEEWLLSQEVTPRTLVALSLARNSLRPNTTQYEVIRRTLRLQLGAKLHSIDRSSSDLSHSLDVHELSTYVTALLATCQDPRRVYGQDVVSLLRNHPRSRTPSVLLALCLANASVAQEDFRLLQGAFDSPVVDEVSKDRFILSTSALACLHKRGLYSNELRSVLGDASRKLLELQYDDGSFGSIYSTALAAQALFALDSMAWNPDRTLDFVIGHRAIDGSFGDTLATSLVLPVLAGRSLLHLREMQCENPKEETPPEVDGRIFDGRTKTVRYTVATGRDRITLPVTVPDHASFFETMQEAQKLHPRFRFRYTETFGKPDVYSLSGVANDPERGTYWQLFVQDRIYEGDLRQLVPGDNEELQYWYLPYRRSFPSPQYTQPKQLDITWD